MNAEDSENLLLTLAVRRVKPYLNLEVPLPPSNTQSCADLHTILWDQGFMMVKGDAVAQGANSDSIERYLADFKKRTDLIEAHEFVAFPGDLQHDIFTDYTRDLPNELPLDRQRLDERWVKEITEFRVEMCSNEGPHAGRPHVRVHLKDRAVTISLDDPPQTLTKSGGLVGEQTALKVVAKYRNRLLKLWYQTRPDDQRVPGQVSPSNQEVQEEIEQFKSQKKRG